MENTDKQIKLPGKELHISKVAIIFAAIFALLGAFFVWHSYASASIVASIEAEQMALPNGGSIIDDANAVGGKAVKLIKNGSMTATLNMPASSDSITVRARGTYCRGNPAFSVLIDGTQVASATTGSNTWSNYSFTTNTSSGSHSLTIRYSNDYYRKGICDRNLYVDQTVFYGQSAPTPTPSVAIGATPTSLTSGSAATLTWSSANVKSCTASGGWSGTEPTSGSTSTGALNTTTKYTLSCSGDYGSATASTTASVSTTTTITPTSTIPLGMNTCCGGTAEESRILASGIKLIRTDRNDYEIPFAHNNGIKVDGIIWLNTSSTGMGADILELDNEPYFTNWNGLTPSAWAQKARDVAKSIKASNPSKPVLLPLLTQVNNGDVNVNGTWEPMVTMINQAAPDIWQYVDGFAVHPYSRPNAPSFTVMDRVRTQLKALGSQADKPFWVTEIGWPTGGTDGSAVSESTQATYLGQFIDQARARTDVASIMPFKLTDDAAYGASSSSEPYYGIYHNDGTKKPAFDTVYSRR